MAASTPEKLSQLPSKFSWKLYTVGEQECIARTRGKVVAAAAVKSWRVFMVNSLSFGLLVGLFGCISGVGVGTDRIEYMVMR